MTRYYGVDALYRWYLVFLWFVKIIGDIHSCQVYWLGCGVVELYPVVFLEVCGIDIDAVVSAYLIDAHWHCINAGHLVGGHWLVTGCKHH